MIMVTATPTDFLQGVYNSHTTDTLNDVNPRFKVGCFTTPTTTTSADTVSINLWENFGIRRFMGFRGYQHVVENSVIEDEAKTTDASVTAMQNNTLTITINGSAGAAKRFYVVYGI